MKVAVSKEIKTIMLKLSPEEKDRLLTGNSIMFDTGENHMFADEDLRFLIIQPEKE